MWSMSVQQNEDGNKEETMFTLLFRKPLAKCSAPSSSIPLPASSSVVSVFMNK
jgi:hypothetical protein